MISHGTDAGLILPVTLRRRVKLARLGVPESPCYKFLGGRASTKSVVHVTREGLLTELRGVRTHDRNSLPRLTPDKSRR